MSDIAPRVENLGKRYRIGTGKMLKILSRISEPSEGQADLQRICERWERSVERSREFVRSDRSKRVGALI